MKYKIPESWMNIILETARKFAEKRKNGDEYRNDKKNAFSRRRKGLSGEFVVCGWAYKTHKINIRPNLDVQERPTKDPDLGLVPVKSGAHYNWHEGNWGLSWLIDRQEIPFHADDVPFVFVEELQDKNGREYKIHGWCSAKDLRWHWDQGHFGEPDLEDLKRRDNKKAIYLKCMKDHGTFHDMEDMTSEQWRYYLTWKGSE